jgi:thioredoxin reductase (NADPH)
MSRYLVDRIEAHERITVRTSTNVSRAEGGDWLERVVVAGPDGEESLEAGGMFVLIGGEPLTAGVEDWLRCDAGGYLMTGSELYAAADRSWWPLARDPLFLESSQPGLFIAGDVRHGSTQASGIGRGRGRDVDLAGAQLPGDAGRRSPVILRDHGRSPRASAFERDSTAKPAGPTVARRLHSFSAGGSRR